MLEGKAALSSKYSTTEGYKFEKKMGKIKSFQLLFFLL